MNKRPLITLILAAGKGTRMKSNLPKVLHPVDDIPMLHHVIKMAQAVGSEQIIPIIGYEKEKVKSSIASFQLACAIQDEQLGTGHAVMQTESIVGNVDGDILVLSGDVPLLRETSLLSLLEVYRNEKASAALLTAEMDDATGYGRIVRNKEGQFSEIVEHKDCTPLQLGINEINAGIYLF
ncbi:MAG: NTP transferase domain-containing protein, partial [Candidatus Marinimicrobia bacterium]|nr:NTP transferase domain-containing protein [Candidatus Neomarinimicrobiota bacterium]